MTTARLFGMRSALDHLLGLLLHLAHLVLLAILAGAEHVAVEIPIHLLGAGRTGRGGIDTAPLNGHLGQYRVGNLIGLHGLGRGEAVPVLGTRGSRLDLTGLGIARGVGRADIPDGTTATTTTATIGTLGLGSLQRLAVCGKNHFDGTILPTAGVRIVGQPLRLALEVVLANAQLGRLLRVELKVDVSVGDGTGPLVHAVGGGGTGGCYNISTAARIRGLVRGEMMMGTGGGCRGGELNVMRATVGVARTGVEDGLGSTSSTTSCGGRSSRRRRGHAATDAGTGGPIRDNPTSMSRPIDAIDLVDRQGLFCTLKAKYFVPVLLLLFSRHSTCGRRGNGLEQIADGIGGILGDVSVGTLLPHLARRDGQRGGTGTVAVVSLRSRPVGLGHRSVGRFGRRAGRALVGQSLGGYGGQGLLLGWVGSRSGLEACVGSCNVYTRGRRCEG